MHIDAKIAALGAVVNFFLIWIPHMWLVCREQIYLVKLGEFTPDHGVAWQRDFLRITYRHTNAEDMPKAHFVGIKPCGPHFAPVRLLSDLESRLVWCVRSRSSASRWLALNPGQGKTNAIG